jgi:RimJ/RimL family protein N-acetyltransferase
VRRHAYEDLGWKTAINLVAADNLASKKVAERLGAKLEKTITLWGEEAGIYRHRSPDELELN